MRVAMGSDGQGYRLKEAIKADLLQQGYTVIDVDTGPDGLYHNAANAVAELLQRGEAERGIGICGTGMGVSIIANKHRGVYAALCEGVYTARRSRVVNNTNMLCMGGWIVGEVMGIAMANAWLEAEYMEGMDEGDTGARAAREKEFGYIVDYEAEAYPPAGGAPRA